MRKIDNKLTQRISDWLQVPEDARNMQEGADMLLALTRNRALYNSVTRNPAKFMPKMVYELRKHLNIRLRHLSTADVARLEKEVVPRVAETVAAPPEISPEDELPEGTVARGKRPDHDSLPEGIRRLWDDNIVRHRKIVLLFNELKAMAGMEPCDRFEKCSIMGDLDAQYRRDMAMYDAYSASSAQEEEEDAAADAGAEREKAVSNARKLLSKYRARMESMDASDPGRDGLIAKIGAVAGEIASMGEGFSKATEAWLAAIGIDVRVSMGTDAAE